MKVLFDTNIILDVYLNREPFTNDSLKLLKLSENKRISGYVTANTITDIYYILGKTIKDKQKLTAAILQMLTVVSVTDVLSSDITKAFALSIEDYEDALITQCAIRTKAAYIITRNIKDFANSPVTVITPQDFLSKFFK
jgi:predicted nucleic acid-binding protein